VIEDHGCHEDLLRFLYAEASCQPGGAAGDMTNNILCSGELQLVCSTSGSWAEKCKTWTEKLKKCAEQQTGHPGIPVFSWTS
jgi:hypothetical protein